MLDYFPFFLIQFSAKIFARFSTVETSVIELKL